MQLVRRRLGDLVADAVVLDESDRLPGPPPGAGDPAAGPPRRRRRSGAVDAAPARPRDRRAHREIAAIDPAGGERADPRRRRGAGRVARRAAGGAGRDRARCWRRLSATPSSASSPPRRRRSRAGRPACSRTTTSAPSTSSSIPDTMADHRDHRLVRRGRRRSRRRARPAAARPRRRPTSTPCSTAWPRRGAAARAAERAWWYARCLVVEDLAYAVRRRPDLVAVELASLACPLRRRLIELCVTAHVLDDLCGDTDAADYRRRDAGRRDPHRRRRRRRCRGRRLDRGVPRRSADVVGVPRRRRPTPAVARPVDVHGRRRLRPAWRLGGGPRR